MGSPDTSATPALNEAWVHYGRPYTCTGYDRTDEVWSMTSSEDGAVIFVDADMLAHGWEVES